ncbi:MAG: hypothetical protein JO128_11725 [Alphaproteobacteria bacterium]|nr:hypothetical protein [Alphaproteobacteria bacterium]
MATKLVAVLLFLSVVSVPAHATDVEWHWIAVVPDYDRATNSRIWFSAQGVVTAKLAARQFKLFLDDGKGNLNWDVTGLFRGERVTARAIVTDTDDDPQHFAGKLIWDHGVARITLVSPDGKFLGLTGAIPK